MHPIHTGKELLKRSFSRGTQLALRGVVNRTKGSLLSLGSAVECPLCGGTFLSFLQFCGRQNEWCPACRSLGRHRLIYLYLRDQTDLLTGRRTIKILHVGPEFCLQPLLASIPQATYVSVDLMVSVVDLLEVKADVCMSITHGCFRSNVFDLVICSHVLEHVKADWQAMAQLFRMTKPGGVAIVPVPIDWKSAITKEQAGLSPYERAELYGEADHVRQYGRDYVQRLRETGFEPRVFRLNDALLAQHYRIDIEDPLILAYKPPQPGDLSTGVASLP